MKRFALPLGVALVALLAVGGVASAQTAPTFKLGFKLLADQVPDIVGQPLEDEHFNPANGDSLQQTTKGLMVWRKADNWTAFTNGSHTWINGPDGIQDRDNNVRFGWEAQDNPAAGSAPASQASPAAPAAPASQASPAAPASPSSASQLNAALQQLIDAQNGSDSLSDMDQLLGR